MKNCAQKWYVEKNQDSVTIRPGGCKLDFSNCDEFEELLQNLLNEGFDRVLLDMRYVAFLDSCMLGILVDGYRKVAGRGEIGLCHLDDNVRNVLELTRLNEVFRIYETLEDALPVAA